MHKWTKSALAAVALTGTLAGCDDFLTGTGVSDNPNAPVEVGTAQLYQAIQLTQTVQHTGDLARHAAMWTQQMAGIGNQYSGRDQYVVTEQDLAAWYNAIYTGGGLIDMREVITRAEAANDRTYAGIVRVWEAIPHGRVGKPVGRAPVLRGGPGGRRHAQAGRPGRGVRRGAGASSTRRSPTCRATRVPGRGRST
jgi:hypothetical protein